MDCESESKQYTCCKRSGRSGKKCNVEALTDRDGRTTTKLNGVLAQDSACEVWLVTSPPHSAFELILCGLTTYLPSDC